MLIVTVKFINLYMYINNKSVPVHNITAELHFWTNYEV